MKRIFKLAGLGIVAVTLCVGSFVASSFQDSLPLQGAFGGDPHEATCLWNHYAAVEPTAERHGSKEFWACCTHLEFVLTLPQEGTIQEGVPFDTTEYFNQLDGNDDRYVPALGTLDKLSFVLSGSNDYYSVQAKDTSIAGEVYIPSTYNDLPVREIGPGAFVECPNITSITVSEGINTLAQSAISSCENLKYLYLPSSITTMGWRAAYPSLPSMTVYCASASQPGGWSGEWTDFATPVVFGVEPGYIHGNIGGNEYYIPKGGEEATLVRCFSPFETFVLPPTVTFNERAYAVTAMGKKAFYGKNQITDITLPSSLVSIEEDAFANCSALTTLTMSSGVTSIGDRAFQGCAALTGIALPSTVTNLGSQAFSGCSQLTSVDLGENITSIGRLAFSGCSRLSSLFLPSSVLTVGDRLFSSRAVVLCEAPSKPAGWDSHWGDNAYILWGTTDRSLYHEENGLFYTLVGDEAKIAYSCDTAAMVEIPAEIVIGGTSYPVTEILDSAFMQCTKLRTLTFADGSSLTRIGELAFWYSSIETVTFPETLQRIGPSAFYNCTSLRSVNFPASLTTIGDSAFYHCGFSSLTLPSTITSMGPSAFRDCTSLTDLTVNAPSIGQEAFRSCNNLIRLTLGDTCRTISSDAFNGCTRLTDVDFGQGVRTIAHRAFRGTGITDISLPASIYSLNYSFSGCSSLESVTFASLNGSIAAFESVFENCTSLSSVTLPDNLTSLGSSSFYRCSSLESIALPDSITSIGYNCFSGCTSLSSITFPSSLTTINGYAFYNCGALPSSLTMPNTLTSIRSKAFGNCTSLTSFTWSYAGDSRTEMSADAFENDIALTYMVLPADLRISPAGTPFAGMDSLTVYCVGTPSSSYYWNISWNPQRPVIFDAGVAPLRDRIDGVEYYVHDGQASIVGADSDLTQPIIPSTVTISEVVYPVTSIVDYAFSCCADLETIYLPSSVTTVGEHAFANTGVTIYGESAAEPQGYTAGWKGDNVVYWDVHIESDYLVQENGNEVCLLRYRGDDTVITIPSSLASNTVTSLGDNAFMGTNITSVTLPNTITAIGASCFENCASLASLTYKGTEADWETINKGKNWNLGVDSEFAVHFTQE